MGGPRSLQARVSVVPCALDDAWRCIGEAMTAVETTKETWVRGRLDRIAGEVALMSPSTDALKAEAYFDRAPSPANNKPNMGTPRLHEPRTPLARPVHR